MGTVYPVICPWPRICPIGDTFDPAPSARAMHDDIDALIRHWRGTLTRPRGRTLPPRDAGWKHMDHLRTVSDPAPGGEPASTMKATLVEAFLAVWNISPVLPATYTATRTPDADRAARVIVTNFLGPRRLALGFFGSVVQKRGTSPVSPTTLNHSRRTSMHLMR